MPVSDEGPVTRRESTQLWDAHRELHGAHERAHDQEHDMTAAALDKAVFAMDRRLEGMNEFRGQLKDQQNTLATRATVETLRSEVDRRFTEQNATMNALFHNAEKLTQERYEANRLSIIELQKQGVKGEGKSLGQGAVIAAIVTGLAVTGTIISLVVVIANLLAK